MKSGTLFIAYHEVPKRTPFAHSLYDGVMVVSAETEAEARTYVEEMLGTHFNGCVIEELVEQRHGVLLEFWRSTPKRPPSKTNPIVEPAAELRVA